MLVIESEEGRWKHEKRIKVLWRKIRRKLYFLEFVDESFSTDFEKFE